MNYKYMFPKDKLDHTKMKRREHTIRISEDRIPKVITSYKPGSRGLQGMPRKCLSQKPEQAAA